MKFLETELKSLVVRERELLHEILICIRKIDEAKLYLEWGFPSLFDYLTREIGYSGASAQRRIDAARLSRELPEVIECIRGGSLNLAQIGEAQKGFRQARPGLNEKKRILARLEASPSHRAQQIVAEELSLPVLAKAVTKPQADGSVRISFNLSAEALESLERVRSQLSHSIPNGDPGSIFERLLNFYLESQAKSASANRATAPHGHSAKNPPASTSSSTPASEQKTLPRPVRRQIFARDQICQFRSASGRVCGSRYQLQIDHRQMRFFGGNHQPENLRLLCGAHNRFVAEKVLKGEAAL